MNKENIKPLYAQLRGLLNQAPEQDKRNATEDSTLWETYNKIVEKLKDITTDEEYKDFVITPKQGGGFDGMLSYNYINVSTYRSKLAGLISYMHARYFDKEPEPFSTTPTTLINQTQSQQQQLVQSFVLQVHEKVLENLANENLESNERDFLQKLKEALPTINGTLSFLQTILNLAKEFGITTDGIIKLLGLF